MPTSSRERVRVMGLELDRYWSLCRKGCAYYRIDPLDPRIDEIRDECEMLYDMTDWPLLKIIIRRGTDLDDAYRMPLVKAAVA